MKTANAPNSFIAHTKTVGRFFELVKGHSNKTVARTLGISPLTVAKHRENIYARLGVSRVGQLAQYIPDHLSRWSLTSREQEIMRMLVQGLTSAQIAEQLGLSTYTVQTHRQNIHKKRQD
ncbi:helix-turn-helix transcriptional regulator [Nitrosomonas halophila]|nr:LuxR C-terminal-related transcriptional regulator [Nitrosomonas halophila]